MFTMSPCRQQRNGSQSETRDRKAVGGAVGVVRANSGGTPVQMVAANRSGGTELGWFGEVASALTKYRVGVRRR